MYKIYELLVKYHSKIEKKIIFILHLDHSCYFFHSADRLVLHDSLRVLI